MRRRHLAAVTLALALAAGGGLIGREYATLPPLDPVRVDERSVTVSDRHGRLLRAFTTGEGNWRLPASHSEVDPRFLALLKAFEDRRFDSHAGVDPAAMLRASWQFLSHGRIVSGGSTLSMQVARLAEARSGVEPPTRGLRTKLRQALRAIQLERRLGKGEILDLYLALAPYGGNVEGVRAAAFTWLGKEPHRLTLAERAVLVAIPQSPEARRPDRGGEALRRARDRVIAAAEKAGLASPEEAEAARAEPVPDRRRLVPMLAAHAAEQALRERPDARRHSLSIDARWQASLETLLRERVSALGPGLGGAVVVVEHATGKVRAHVGGAGLLDRERAGALDLARGLRSPGSALKPFIYALAFEDGVAHPETMLEDRPNRFGAYAPENFDLGFQGTVTARQALQQSLNLPAISLLAEVAPQRLLTRLNGAGGGLVLPKDSAPGLAIGLGGVGIRLVDLAQLYAGLARGGEALPLSWREGEPAGEPLRLTDGLAAWYVGDVLRGAPPPVHAPGNRIAYKTGTSYGYRDAWAVGFDARHTIAVWIGRPDGASTPGLVARQTAAPLLFEAFARIGITPDTAPPPREALSARTAELPPPLRHLRRDIPKTASAAARAPLRIAFPPDGARLDVGLRQAREASPVLTVKALGGAGGLIWLVDGVPATAPSPRREASLDMRGAGFVRLTVIDAEGATDSVTVSVE